MRLPARQEDFSGSRSLLSILDHVFEPLHLTTDLALANDNHTHVEQQDEPRGHEAPDQTLKIALQAADFIANGIELLLQQDGERHQEVNIHIESASLHRV